MVTFDRYYDVSQAPDAESFRQRLVAFAHELDFGIVSVALVTEQPGQRPVFVSTGNVPAEYLAQYSDADNSGRDPVLYRLRRTGVPITYSQHDYVAAKAPDLWEEQARFGFRTGVAVALHLPGRQHFLLGVDREQALPEDPERLTRLLADIQLMAVHAHSAASKFLAPTGPRREIPQLSQRELEVLKWTAVGKSAGDVATILDIHVSTVNYHLGRIFAKLGVYTKLEAALEALRLGLIV